MLAWLRQWRRTRYLRDHLVSASAFTLALGRAPACNGLDGTEQARLRGLVTLFLREKVIELDEKVGEYRNMEKTLRDTLLTAERVMTEARQNARKEADLILRDAQMKALLMLEANDIADRLVSILHYNGMPIPSECVVTGVTRHQGMEVAA